MSPNRKIILCWLFIIGLAIITGLGIGLDMVQEKSSNPVAATYYQALMKGCYKKQSSACCLASLRTMIRNKYLLAPQEGCPEGFKPNEMRCIDSYHWCQPNPK